MSYGVDPNKHIAFARSGCLTQLQIFQGECYLSQSYPPKIYFRLFHKTATSLGSKPVSPLLQFASELLTELIKPAIT